MSEMIKKILVSGPMDGHEIEIHKDNLKIKPRINVTDDKGQIFVYGLDMDYRGEMFEIIKKLLQFGPSEVKYKRAICEICKKPEAIFTQVFYLGAPVTKGMPSIIPEDGTYEYKPVCRYCFKRF